MHHSGVIAPPESLANLWKRKLGEFAAEVHRDLAGVNKYAGARSATKVIDGEAEIRSRRSHNRRSGDFRS